MRERGVQSRRLRPGGVEPEKRPNPGPGGGTNVWQIIAIVALLFATAGWTTVAVITLRPATAAVDTTPTDTEDPTAGEESVPPVADSHDATELEALLPTELTGTPLQAQSWTGDVYLAGDDWGNSVTSFLTANGKTPSDFRAAQVADPAGIPGRHDVRVPGGGRRSDQAPGRAARGLEGRLSRHEDHDDHDRRQGHHQG